MSRSGYTDDCDNDWRWVMWRGAVAQATAGKRGQAFLREMLTALDAMPAKQLIAHDLVVPPPDFIPPNTMPLVCAIGAVGLARGVDMTDVDPEDPERVAKMFGIAPALAAEIVYMNDENYYRSAEARWTRVREWVATQIRARSRE